MYSIYSELDEPVRCQKRYKNKRYPRLKSDKKQGNRSENLLVSILIA